VGSPAPSLSTRPRVNPRLFWAKAWLLLERNGLPPMGLHALRRTASSVVSSQTDILSAAEMLGLAHAAVTARHYARAGEDAAERAAEALERELLQTDNPVQLAKTGGAREEAGGSAPPNTAQMQEKRGAHPEGFEPPTPGSEEQCRRAVQCWPVPARVANSTYLGQKYDGIVRLARSPLPTSGPVVLHPWCQNGAKNLGATGVEVLEDSPRSCCWCRTGPLLDQELMSL
jgi:hypothetical protein